MIKRAGTFVKQLEGYKAFMPSSLSGLSIKSDDELSYLLSEADRALGRLDGVADTLPNPNLFVGMYVRKEALLSSQIEGTQASLVDILEFESAKGRHKYMRDVQEVINYVRAMNYGLERLKTLPLSTRLLCEIHEKLLKNTRGSERNPGCLRNSQNWIGPHGCTLNEAAFIPPPPHVMEQAMSDLERYLHNETLVLPLIKCGIVHSQFETIHPFLDGNGRMGRLLITFLLCQQNILSRPLLYLSYYFKQHRLEYYDRLQAVRLNDDWEGWLKFFLCGVYEVSRQASDTARKILALQQEHQVLIQKDGRMTKNYLNLLNILYEYPLITIPWVAGRLTISYPSANTIIKRFEELNLLKEVTGKQRNRGYEYKPYMDILKEGTQPIVEH